MGNVLFYFNLVYFCNVRGYLNFAINYSINIFITGDVFHVRKFSLF